MRFPCFAIRAEIGAERLRAVIIADGLKGASQEALRVKGGKHIKKAFIAADIAGADLLVSINHAKGHELAGFGGALKNIFAIAGGMVDALGYGDNAKAAMLTRGLAEMTRLGVAAGADPLTFLGLAGIGDLIATAYSGLSRNRRLGELLGRGLPLGEALAQIGETAEGAATTPAALGLAAVAAALGVALLTGGGPAQAQGGGAAPVEIRKHVIRDLGWSLEHAIFGMRPNTGTTALLKMISCAVGASTRPIGWKRDVRRCAVMAPVASPALLRKLTSRADVTETLPPQTLPA